MTTSDERPQSRKEPDPRTGHLERRDAIRALVGLGLATGLGGCARAADPSVGPSPSADATPDPSTGEAVEPGTAPLETVGTEAREPELPSTTAPGADHDHPAAGDLLVFAFGPRAGEAIRSEDIPVGGPQVFANPMDATGSHVASESRLDQVMLVRLEEASMTPETSRLSVEGILAFSAVCTHTGCEVSDWKESSLRFKCPCHDSEFDPADNGRAVRGPARRRLAALPLRIQDGVLTVAGGFTGRVGAERPR
jgi:Rieske Fe-S protein